jgi:hydroxymethylbilane synthase
MNRVLRIATRTSPLALWQSNDVADRIRAYDIAVEVVPLDTFGDRTQALGTPLHQIGGQGVFVKEVQAAVLDGRADIAVHSAKDLHGQPTPGLVLAAVPRRDDPRDGLVGVSLADLRGGAVVASGSIRRRAQLLAIRPDLRFVEVRGNMARRVEKASEPGIDAVVVGCAGLDRIGLGHHIAQRLDPDLMLPQVAQAAVAVECLSEDSYTYDVLRNINDVVHERAVIAERGFLHRLGAGCQLPVGAFTRSDIDGVLSVEGLIASMDGGTILRSTVTGTDVHQLGDVLATALLDAGGSDLLASLDADLGR